jgi:hypothetical protein
VVVEARSTESLGCMQTEFLEAVVLLVVAVGGLAWGVTRFLRGSSPSNESSARADPYSSGSGYAAEQADKLRNFDR